MNHTLRAVVCGVVVAVACSPAVAQAAPKKAAKLTVSRISKPPSSAEAGSKFKVTARIANAKNRKSSAGRITLSLRPSSGKATNLKSYSVKSVKAGKTRSLSLTITVPASLKAGTYSLRVCVNRSGSSAKTCKTAGRITVRVKPVPTPAPTPAPQPAPAPTPAPVSATGLENAITAASMRKHLEAFQEAADQNGGNRASGLQGYGATQKYVVDTLRAAGYTPTVQQFPFLFFRQLDDSEMVQTAPTARTFVEDEDFILMSYSGSGDTTAPIRAIDLALAPPRASTSGCEATDFAALVPGEIALMQRGTCDFGVKVANAEEAGASGAIIFNQGNTTGADRNDVFAGTLGRVVGIPAVGISFAEGEALAARRAPRSGWSRRPGRRARDRQRDRRDRRRRPDEGRPRRLAPRRRAGRPGHQRQRHRLGVQPRAGHPDGEDGRTRQQGAVRVLGRRGGRPARLDRIRQRDLERGLRRTSR